ncbi:MAG: alkaline phosphatase D family protein [Aquisalimonadaceae bacterium]
MAGKLLVGPILGLEGESAYTFCFLTPKDVDSAEVLLDQGAIPAQAIETLPDGIFWRAQANVEVPSGETGAKFRYEIHLNGQMASDAHGRSRWGFYVPAVRESPRIAYASCNGVSKSDLITQMEDPFRLWREMSELHHRQPLSLLLMGGDQLYADAVWARIDALDDWASLKLDDQIKRKPNKTMSAQLDRFYCRLYRQRWLEKYMSYMFASVPSIMMWDDHDIFDGWGSYPRKLQQCGVFAEIFRHARKYFELFQVRSTGNTSLLASDGRHYSSCVRFRDYTILALDNRSERSITQVMSAEHWRDIIACLDGVTSGTLLVMSAVPVVYRDFSFTETAFDVTPWDESLTDDIKDHWRAREHQGERNRLIMRLLRNARSREENDGFSKTVLLSGDVHVGCLGVISDKTGDQPIKVHQIVSSGIVHPAPTLMQWLGIQAVTNDDLEFINEERSIQAAMLKPVGSKRYIRARNFVTIHRGTDEKLWANWIVESAHDAETDEKPVYPIN